MKAKREATIRQVGHGPINRMLDWWHALCAEKFGTTFEVVAVNRHDHHEFQLINAPVFCTAELISLTIEGEDVEALVVYLEDTNQLNHIHFTHEVAHELLQLQGFGLVLFERPPSAQFRDGFLSMCHHPLVYLRQREVGQDPQGFIDHRARYHLQEFGGQRETGDPIRRLELAVAFADDLLSCSPDLKAEYLRMLRRDHPRTAALTQCILDAATEYDPVTHYRLFAQHALWRLGIFRGFTFIDRVEDVRLALAERRAQTN